MRWLRGVVLALAGITSGALELWMGSQGASSGGYALLPVLALGSLVLIAGGFALLPGPPLWAAGCAAAVPLLVHLLMHARSALLPLAAVLAGALTWLFRRFSGRLPLALLANLLLLVWWLGLAAENARAFWPRTEEEARGRPFALAVTLVALLLAASAAAAISLGEAKRASRS
jgi:hypothetical protein